LLYQDRGQEKESDANNIVDRLVTTTKTPVQRKESGKKSGTWGRTPLLLQTAK
jgi:hypothetical protein